MISKLSSFPSRLFNLPLLNNLDANIEEIVRGASVAFVLKVIGAGLAFMFNVVLARLLGANGAGIYFLALSAATIATVFGRIGLDNALLRFISANAATGNWALVKGVYGKGIKLGVSASGLSALLLFLLSPGLSELVFKKPELQVPMRWMCLAVVPMSLLMLHAESIKGLKRISASLFVQSVSVPGFSLVGISVFAHFWGIMGAVWAYTLAAICTMISGIWLWRRFTPHLKDYQSYFETCQLVRTSMPLFWVASMNLLMNWTSTFMLGIWGTSSDVGVFSVAHRTAFQISLILIAVNSIAAPKFAEFHKKGDAYSLAHTAQNSTKLSHCM